MIIGVALKGPFTKCKQESVVIPLDTDFTQPEESAVRAVCDIELKKLYPLHSLSAEYEIDSLDKVLSKIKSAQTVE